jgi:hypothetical protein
MDVFLADVKDSLRVDEWVAKLVVWLAVYLVSKMVVEKAVLKVFSQVVWMGSYKVVLKEEMTVDSSAVKKV